jgi:hypothetical protein
LASQDLFAFQSFTRSSGLGKRQGVEVRLLIEDFGLEVFLHLHIVDIVVVVAAEKVGDIFVAVQIHKI